MFKNIFPFFLYFLASSPCHTDRNGIFVRFGHEKCLNDSRISDKICLSINRTSNRFMCLLENLTGVCSGDYVNDSDCKQTVANISCKHGEVYIPLNDEIKTYCNTLAWMWINPPYHKNPMYCQLSCSQWWQGISFFLIRMLFSRARLNILIFPPILGFKYSCIILNNSL